MNKLHQPIALGLLSLSFVAGVSTVQVKSMASIAPLKPNPFVQTQPIQSMNQPKDQPVWHNCLTREVWSPEKRAWCTKLQKLQNTTYTLPNYGSVTLELGVYENTEQRFDVTLANRQGLIDFGDLNGDGVEDAVVLLGVNSGGSGQFTYLVPVLDVNDTMQQIEPVLLGDRVQTQLVSIQNNQVTLNLVTQGPTDPLCCPTQAVTRVYELQQTVLAQVGGDPAKPMPLPSPLPNQQATQETIVFLENANYAVRIFRQAGQPQINLYNQQTKIVELRGVPVTVESTPEGTVYSHQGEMTVRVVVANNGTRSWEINGTAISEP